MVAYKGEDSETKVKKECVVEGERDISALGLLRRNRKATSEVKVKGTGR